MSKYIIVMIRIMWKAGQSWHENTKFSTGVFKATFLNCVNKWKRMSEKTLYFQQAFKRHPWGPGEGSDRYGWRVIYVDIPRFINNWYLVESLLPENFHSLCTGNSWEHSQGGREAQLLNTDVPPPGDGMKNKPKQVLWRTQNQSFRHSGLQHHWNDKRLQGRVRMQPESVKLQDSQVSFPISESYWSVRKFENKTPFLHFICFLWLQIVSGER